MYKLMPILVILFSFFGFSKNGNSIKSDNNSKLAVSTIMNSFDIDPISDKNTQAPFYIISISAKELQSDAINEVIKQRKTHTDVNYLWIPDYESLSGKKMYVIFLGPYTDMNDAYKNMITYKKENSGAYVVKVSHEKKRITLLGKFDYRINDVRQKLIIAYAEEKALEEYYNQGGEDWGWFNGDVYDYFNKNFPNENITVFIGEPEWLTAADMNKFAKEIGNNELYFGYYLIDGNNKLFIQHNLSDQVISEACNFFGLQMPETEGDY